MKYITLKDISMQDGFRKVTLTYSISDTNTGKQDTLQVTSSLLPDKKNPSMPARPFKDGQFRLETLLILSVLANKKICREFGQDLAIPTEQFVEEVKVKWKGHSCAKE